MHQSVDITVNRTQKTVMTTSLLDFAAIKMIDIYGSVSSGWMQRGLYKICKLAGHTFWQNKKASIILSPASEVCFDAADPYWNRMFLHSYDHEPELARFLRLIADVDYTFIDCGANIGYWSVFVADPNCGGGKQVLAIEASGETFSKLQSNSQSNKINALQAAILDKSGVEVILTTSAHEARGIDIGNTTDSLGERVISITVDDLAQKYRLSELPLVIKLDVEGVEREALAGMTNILKNDALVIYEDHGADSEHQLTHHILNDLKMSVYLLTDFGTVPITTSKQLDSYKIDKTKGYNLLAMRSISYWKNYTL